MDGKPLNNRKEIAVAYDRDVDQTNAVSGGIYYYAPILLDEYDFGNSINPRAVGLLLDSVDDSMGRFRRVGHISQRYYPDDKPDMRLPLGNERNLPAWDYNEVTGEHDFYIV